jgi:hypothetical protein
MRQCLNCFDLTARVVDDASIGVDEGELAPTM